MFCLWWKVCLSPSSNIYLAQLLSLIQTTHREKWSRESLFEFNLSVTCSILRVICQLDRRHTGVIWQWTWHGSCDMTWYDIMTTLVGGHRASKHWYCCCEIGSPEPILTLLLLLRILTLLRRLRISMFVWSHWAHIPLMVWHGLMLGYYRHYHGSDIKTR